MAEEEWSMVSNECKFLCPNCWEVMVSEVPGEAECQNAECPYMFKVYSKRSRKKSKDFYLTVPSKRAKCLWQAEDGCWIVAYGEKSVPFVVETILDLIEPGVLQTIQVGLSERFQRPTSIYVKFRKQPEKKRGEFWPVDIIERKGEIFGRINPIKPTVYHCKRCSEIRRFPKGDELCVNFDIGIAKEIIEAEKPKSKWIPCWSGLIDYAIPVIINDFVTGLFFTGQIRWTDPEGEKKLVEGSERASQIVPLTKKHLMDLANEQQVMTADKDKINALMVAYEGLVKTISNVAEDRFWAERRVRESEFMSELIGYFMAVDSKESLWTVLKAVLKRLNGFSFFRYSAFLFSSRDSEGSYVCKASAGFELDENAILDFEAEEGERIFEKEVPFDVRERGVSRDNIVYIKVLDFISVEELNCAFLFPVKMGELGKGLLLLAERLPAVPGDRIPDYVSGRRKEFLEKVVHEIRIQVQNIMTISELRKTLQERDELMATAGHQLVAPLDSAYGKTERLTALVGDHSPHEIMQNSKRIQDLCRSIDKDIVQSIHKARSFMFFITIGTEAEEYRLDQPISLGDLITEIAEDFQFLAGSRGIEIETFISDNVPPARFDKDKLEVVLSNLLDNAVKFSHGNRSIRLNLSFDKQEKVYTISVSDFGIGIHEIDYDRIFEKFYRSELKDPKRFIPGTGIGLTVVRQIVNRHNGKVWVTSTQGKGDSQLRSTREGFNTTFWIKIHQQRKAIS